MSALPLGVPLLLIVILGPAVAFGRGELPAVPLLLWLLTSLAAIAVVARFRRIDSNTLWVWLLLALFAIGYFAKGFFAATWLAREGSLEQLNPEWARFTMEDIVVGYEVTCLAFLGFVASLRWSLRPSASPAETTINVQRARVSLVMLAIAALVLAALRTALAVGVMGVENDELPLGIDTVLFRAQSLLIPALLLVVMWSGERSGRPLESNLAAIVLGVHLSAVAAVAASKAGLMYFALYVVGLWIACGRLTRARTSLLVLLGILAVLAFVVSAELRTLRVEGWSLPEAVKLAMADVGAASSIASIHDGLQAIFLRVIGADGIWFVMSDAVWSVAPLPERLSAVWHASIVELYTRDIVGVTWLQDFRAPGFVGAFMLVFGAPGLLLCLLVGPAVSILWALIGRAPGAAALAAFSATFVMQTFMDGTFRWQDFAAFSMTLPIAAAFGFWLQEAKLEGPTVSSTGEGARAWQGNWLSSSD